MYIIQNLPKLTKQAKDEMNEQCCEEKNERKTKKRTYFFVYIKKKL